MIVSPRYKDSLSDMSQSVGGCWDSDALPVLAGEKLNTDQEDLSQGRAQDRAHPIL